MSLTDIFIILEKYKYLVIFPIAVVEGPIIMVISGFLVYLGILNSFIAFFILVIADLVGDSLYYSVGKYGRNIVFFKKIGHFLGYDAEIKTLLHNHFEKHSMKTLLLAKISHGVGSIVQIVAGITKFNFGKYLFIETIGTIPKTFLLMILGFYIGGSYIKINTYIQSIGAVVMLIAITTIILMVLSKHVKNLINKTK